MRGSPEEFSQSKKVYAHTGKLLEGKMKEESEIHGK